MVQLDLFEVVTDSDDPLIVKTAGDGLSKSLRPVLERNWIQGYWKKVAEDLEQGLL